MGLTVLGFVFVLRTLVQFLGHQTTFLGGVVSVDVVGLHLRKVELLRTKDRAGSGDPYPANEGFSWDLEVLHGPETDEGTCSAETCFAMDGDGAVVWLLEVFVHYFKEISYDFVWGCGSINEE